MKTAYYTFTIWDDGAMAAGSEGAAEGTRRTMMVRQPEEHSRAVGGRNVIDLNVWRAAELCLPQEEEPDEPAWDEEVQEEPEPPVLRRRRRRRTMAAAELASTLCVAAAAAAIVLRVLTF